MPDGAKIETATPAGPAAEGRADAILAQARAAFVEKGFDGASMQDLARAAGMSAGNFYRYFPSKAALVEALIERDVCEIEREFQKIAAAPEPLAALKSGFREHLAATCGNPEDDALWAEIWAAAARKPEVAQALQRMEDSITSRIAQALALACGVPDAEAGRRFGTHARVVFLIIHGMMTGNRPEDAADDGLMGLVMRTIDWVLDDAVSDRKDPCS